MRPHAPLCWALIAWPLLAVASPPAQIPAPPPADDADQEDDGGDDLPGTAREKAPEDPRPVPRALGVGITAWREHGYGALIRWRPDEGPWALEAAAALALYSLDSGEGDPCDRTVINAPFRATAAGLWYFTDAGRNAQHAIKAGALYDVEFGPGALAGYHGEFSLTRSLAFTLGLGMQWMPDAQNQARQVLRKICDDHAFADPETFDIELRPYLGLGLTYYW